MPFLLAVEKKTAAALNERFSFTVPMLNAADSHST